MSYGAQYPKDVEVLELVLGRYEKRPCRFLEIGLHVGDTGHGISDFCKDHQIALDYWGLDVKKPERFLEGANFVQGDSAESFHLVPDELDCVLIDGCHCVNHVILDTLHYSRKVRLGGFLLFHDINPDIQHTMKDPHGPNVPLFHNSVIVGLSMIQFPFPPWVLFDSRWDKGASWGGMAAYQKKQ